MDVRHRFAAEVPDARLHVEASVRFDEQHAVEAIRSGEEGAHRHPDAAHLRAGALAALSLPLVPLEQLAAAIERFPNEGAGRRHAALGPRAGRSGHGGSRRRVDATHRDLIDAQLPGAGFDRAVHDRDPLHAARLALRHARRRIGQHRQRPVAHRRRLVHERANQTRNRTIALRLVRTVVGDDEEIHRREFAVLRESGLHPAVKRGPGAAHVVLFFAGDAHHDRRVRLLGEQRRNRHRHVAGDLAAEPAARVLADHDHVVRRDARQRRRRRRPSAPCFGSRNACTACRSASRPWRCAARASDG